jgi:hypothetical protein
LKRYAVFLSFFVCSCTTLDILDYRPIPSLPSELGEYDKSMLEKTKCPDLEGSYVDSPDMLRSDVDQKLVLHADREHIYRLFPFYEAKLSTIEVEHIPEKDWKLKLAFDSDSNLILQRRSYDGQLIEESVFSNKSEIFSCSNGVMSFENHHYYGAVQEGSKNSQFQVQARKLKDGSLLMIWSGGPLKGEPSKARNDFVNHFYRFSPNTKVKTMDSSD